MSAFDRPTQRERAAWPVTAEAAESVSPYELAYRWGGLAWPVRVPAEAAVRAGIEARTVVDELQELAAMTALARWLDRWTPVAAHRALAAGAGVQDAAAAAGLTPAGLADRWGSWSHGQRSLWQARPALHPGPDAAAEHDRVAVLLAAHQAEHGASTDETREPAPVGDVDTLDAIDPTRTNDSGDADEVEAVEVEMDAEVVS